jgi:cell division protein FtsX
MRRASLGALRRLIAAAIAVGLVAAGCGGSNDSDSAPEQTTTTTERTTTTVIGIERDTEIAVRNCVDKMKGIGYSYALGDEAAIAAAEEACDEAVVLVDVDSAGVPLASAARRIKVKITERRAKVAILAVTASMQGVSAEEASELDGTWMEWAADIERILETGGYAGDQG